MKIDGRTRLFGVIGDPVEQIRTPHLINPLFEAHSSAIVAVPMQIMAKDLKQAWSGLRRIKNLAGLGVTVPHKIAVVSLCDEVEAYAHRVGAVNVVRREADGRMRGTLFDGLGFIAGLRAQGYELAGRSVFVAGAGGAATAIAFALAEAGVARITLWNRTRTRAAALIARLCHAFPKTQIVLAESGDPTQHNIVVNATSLGLSAEDPMPFRTERLTSDMVVADIVMQPATTKLLELAKELGCSIHSGHHMLEQQIALIAEFIEGR